jgi:hypothetical protein
MSPETIMPSWALPSKMADSMHLLFFTFTGCILMSAVGILFKNLVLSPLKNIPGPKLAAASRIWIWLLDLTGKAPESIRQLHITYGERHVIA